MESEEVASILLFNSRLFKKGNVTLDSLKLLADFFEAVAVITQTTLE